RPVDADAHPRPVARRGGPRSAVDDPAHGSAARVFVRDPADQRRAHRGAEPPRPRRAPALRRSVRRVDAARRGAVPPLLALPVPPLPSAAALPGPPPVPRAKKEGAPGFFRGGAGGPRGAPGGRFFLPPAFLPFPPLGCLPPPGRARPAPAGGARRDHRRPLARP